MEDMIVRRRLIDVRQFPEFAAGHIKDSMLVPLHVLDSSCESWDRQQPITLICRSGRRAAQARDLLATRGFVDLAVLPGGIEAWSAAGRPLIQSERRPWSLERQVRLVAGLLILLTLALAVTVSHWFLYATAFVGAGLTFAGLSDVCMMASILGRLPWNRCRGCA